MAEVCDYEDIGDEQCTRLSLCNCENRDQLVEILS